MALLAFQPQGNTVLVAATSSTSVAPTQMSTAIPAGVLITNPSTVSVYIAFGSSSVAAGQPTTGTPCVGMCLPGSMQPRAFVIPPSTANNWISAVTSAGTAAPGIFVTPGFGQ